MSDAETLVTTLRDYFAATAQWNDKVDTLNDTYQAATAPADPIRLRHLAKVYIAERKRTSIPQFPVLFILSINSENLNFKEDTDDWSHTVTIGVIEQGQDEDVLDIQIKRYLEDVVWALLKAGHFAGSIGGYHLVINEAAGPDSLRVDWGETQSGAGTMTQDAKFTIQMEA